MQALSCDSAAIPMIKCLVDETFEWSNSRYMMPPKCGVNAAFEAIASDQVQPT